MNMATTVLLPIVIPLSAAFITLLLWQQPRVQRYFATGSMATALLASLWLLTTVARDGTQVAHVGGWFVGGVPVGITLVGDWLAALMVVMSQTVLTFGFIYALGCNDKVVTYPSFYTLFLTLAVGLTGAMLTGDIFNLFVFIELLVISGAILTALSDDRFGTEAAFKYFYISLLAAAFLLLASGLLYISYGTLNMAALGRAIQAEATPLALVAGGLLLSLFLVKSAGAPFHFWQPDFHTAAPTPVHAVLSSVVVKLGVYGFLRMTGLLYVEQAALIQTILLIVGVFGVFYGSLGAAGTYDAKRMLAYSTMGQLGFIFVGIGWGTPLAVAAALVFAFNHSLIKAAMLMLAGTVASRAPIKSAEFTNITGVGSKHPLIGVLFFLGALALAGIPPTNGFVSKLLLFNSGVDAAGYWPLALIGFGSILTLVYMMRAFMRIWFEPLPEGAKVKPTGDRLLAPALLIGLALLFGLWPEPIVQLATATADWLATPNAYIDAVLGSAVAGR